MGFSPLVVKSSMTSFENRTEFIQSRTSAKEKSLHFLAICSPIFLKFGGSAAKCFRKISELWLPYEINLPEPVRQCPC